VYWAARLLWSFAVIVARIGGAGRGRKRHGTDQRGDQRRQRDMARRHAPARPAVICSGIVVVRPRHLRPADASLAAASWT